MLGITDRNLRSPMLLLTEYNTTTSIPVYPRKADWSFYSLDGGVG